jgi:hypothetical protein
MPRYLILCQSEVTAKSLEAWRELLGGGKLHGLEQTPEPIVFAPSLFAQEGGVVAYRTLVQRIESAAGLSNGISSFGEVVVMVDGVCPRSLSAISDGGTWDHLIAMLVLTFPEIRWTFGVIQGAVFVNDDPAKFPVEEHDLLSLLLKPRRDPLLDPTGLREWVKSRTNDSLRLLKEADNQEEIKLPKRTERAASIDEEAEYALMNGYAAYRYGFRADVVTSWSLMEHLFGEPAVVHGEHGYTVILEDMRLNFSDKPARVHLSRLGAYRLPNGRESGRSHHCPLLNDACDASRWRFLITTGQMGDDKELVEENNQYLARKLIGRGDVFYKPMGGIVDLWERTGLTEDLIDGGRSGNAPGFVWPPTFQEEGPTEGHGSPGKLALVAAALLQRVDGLRKNANTVMECIRGAVLAVEATELLGGRTPTLTLSGLSLKHEFEVKAECAFVGAGYHFSLKRRLDEISAEVRSVTQWFYEDNQKKSEWDARASILNRLILVFREAGQMEEERECLVALRGLNRKMSRPKRLNLLGWGAHALLSYGEWLLVSFDRLLLLTFFWLIVLAESAWLIKPNVKTFSDTTDSVSTVISWFLGASAEPGEPWLLMVVSWFSGFAGVFHLGILIAYLYSLISRK